MEALQPPPLFMLEMNPSRRVWVSPQSCPQSFECVKPSNAIPAHVAVPPPPPPGGGLCTCSHIMRLCRNVRLPGDLRS